MAHKAYLYITSLAIAAAVVFFVAYFSGRRPSLEDEMARLRHPRDPVTVGKGQGIPSLQQPAPPPEQPASAPAADPGVQELGEGATVTREPVAEPGIVVVVDTAAVAAAPAGVREELERFLATPPAAERIGLRALAGPTQECGSVGSIRMPGPWNVDELGAALAGALAVPAGPRDPVRALGEAERDLGDVPGRRAVIVIAGGAGGCGGDLCAATAAAGTPVHVILLDGGAAAGDGAAAGGGADPADPAWAAGYRCAAERSGGSVRLAAAAGELERRLREVALAIESAVTVHAFHGAGVEVQGTAPEGEAAWRVTIAVPGAEGQNGTVRLSPVLPASFAVPAGTWVVRCRFRGIERVMAVAVGPGEHAVVRVPFATGELYVEARDTAGGEIAGDSAGFGCAWGAAVLDAEGQELVTESCALPARFELPEGEYQVRVKWKGREESLTGVTVERGESAVRSVDFSAKKQ